MKKFLSLLLAVMMLLGCLPAIAEDDPEWKIDEFTGLVSRRSAAEKLESIVIPAEVNGIAVRGIEYMAFNMHKNFKQLTIADSAVMLDRRVLRDLPKLEALDLPENLLIIREGNFTNLPKLTSVVIPANVVLVHSSFNKCASLTSITFEGMCPVFVTEGTFGMFTDLPADCVIYVPDNQVGAYKAALADREDVVARIQPSGSNAVKIDRTAPESDFVFDASTGTITGYTGTANCLVIPAAIGGVQVKHIAADALLKKHSLCYIVVPEGVESLGAASLAGVENLSYVSLPSTLTNVGDSAFSVSRVSAIAYNTAAVPAYDTAAFANIKSDAWQLILPYGTSQEQVDAFAAYIAAGAPKCVVKASIIEPYSFPKLDVETGAPYIGNWTAVAVTDGTDFYGMDLLGISMTVVLNDDGTGVVDMDGDMAPGGWYVEDGTAIFAPILEEGGQPDPEEAMPFTQDENGRMCLDLGGLIVLMEKEGAEYAVPAIPEKPWPELDMDKAQYYVGTWDAVSYVVDGETYDAALMGPTTLILNADGTARMIEGEEEPYELYWYAESYSAYVGPAMSALAEIYFDMNGDLQMKQDGAKIIMKPHVDVKVIEGADELLGDWYDDLGNKLTVTNDGNLTVTYASDGWVRELKWDMVDGAATVTEGLWVGCPIVLENGIVIISGDNAFQLFSVDGDLSAYYGDDDEDMPEAQPIGAEGEPYFGIWKADMYGIEVILTMNPDGTCAMEMFGEADHAVWTVVDGKANVMGDELYIDGDGNLVYASQGMVFTKAGDADSAAGPATIFGRWEDNAKYVDVYEDGRVEMTYKSDGYVSHISWEMVDDVPTGNAGLWKGIPLTIENGKLVVCKDTYFQEFSYVGAIPGYVPAEPDPAPTTDDVDHVPGTMDDFIGGWICKADPNMQILLLEGEANLIDGGELYTTTWSLVDGVAEFDGMKLYITDNYSIGVLDMYGELVEFERGYVEKPKASASVPGEPSVGGEFSTLPENLQSYVGTWHLVYLATGGLEGDLRSSGLTGKLELNADGNGRLSGVADDSGKWYDDEGTVRFGKADTPLVLLDGGFLRYGNQLSGYMVFSQNESATWTPASAAIPVPAPTAVPAAPVTGGDGSYVGKTFVLTSAATVYAGQSFPVDVSAFGEYKVCFHENGTATFMQAGVELPADYLVWSINADGAYVLTYAMGVTVIMEYIFTPAGGALNMDYYGTMMTFTPAE